MWGIIKNGYRSGWAYMLICPLLFLVPVAIEMLQHIVEVQIGMYDSVEAAKAVEHHPARMAFGMLKIAAITLSIYWVTRFAAFNHDPSAPTRKAPQATRLFSVYFLFQLIFAGMGLWLSSIDPTLFMIESILSLLISGALLCWGVAATLGNRSIGPIESTHIAGIHIIWIGLFGLIAILPLMVPHYGLAILALKANPGPIGLWVLLAIDSILVGLLTAVMVATSWYLGQWIAARKGISLFPQQ